MAPNTTMKPRSRMPKRVPRVADEAEYAGQVERDGGHQPEDGDLVRLQMQLVLEEEADRNIDQAAEGRTEGQQNDQDAEVKEDPLPHRVRQGGGIDGDGRTRGGRTVSRHRAQSSPASSSKCHGPAFGYMPGPRLGGYMLL